MTNGIRFAEGLKILPVLGPLAVGAAEAVTAGVDMDMANWCTFLVNFGNMTSCDSDACVVLARCSSEATSATTEPLAIPFWYRISGPVNTDAMGAIAHVETSDNGFGTSDVGHADDFLNATLVVDIDPAEVAARAAQQRWVSLSITPTGPIAILGEVAVVEHKYPGNSIPSST